MDEKKCEKCGKDLCEECTCTCNENLCKKDCECNEDCNCGCKANVDEENETAE